LLSDKLPILILFNLSEPALNSNESTYCFDFDDLFHDRGISRQNDQTSPTNTAAIK